MGVRYHPIQSSKLEARTVAENPLEAPVAPLYISRPVLNVDEVMRWAASQGLQTMLLDLHVTILFSKQPVMWWAFTPDLRILRVTGSTGDDRKWEKFGTACVQRFDCPELTTRQRMWLNAGASSDFPDYKAHVTITYNDPQKAVEPYTGAFVLGPEIFKDIVTSPDGSDGPPAREMLISPGYATPGWNP